MREEADSAWAEKGALGVRGQGRQGAAGTKCTLRKKIAQGSARGQCPVVLCEREGGAEGSTEGGGRREDTVQEGGDRYAAPKDRGNQQKLR